MPRYAELIYNGFWFSPEREMLQALIDRSQAQGHRPGAPQALQGQRHRRGPANRRNSLYSLEHVTFEDDQVYDQRDAEGFIKLNALRLRLLNRQRG